MVLSFFFVVVTIMSRMKCDRNVQFLQEKEYRENFPIETPISLTTVQVGILRDFG